MFNLMKFSIFSVNVQGFMYKQVVQEMKLEVFCVESSSWASGVHDHFVAVAEYDFDAQNDDELSFKQGTMLTVAPKGLLISKYNTHFTF